MKNKAKNLNEILQPNEVAPSDEWQLRAIQNEQCMSYLLWNTRSREALVIDPKQEEFDAMIEQARELRDYTWLAVIDTHTHADHISCAAKVAEVLKAPLVMHESSPSKRVHLRVCKDASLPTHAGPIRFVMTPGHTPDGMCVLWGPFLFTGDTILYGDTGRDDLPGGDAAAHYESMQSLKAAAQPESIMLPGHEFKAARASSWKTQLSVNASLTQGREEFVSEAGSFTAPAPALLKESLKENFK